MNFDFDELTRTNAFKLLSSVVVPRPIAWVVTQSSEGRINAAPFSFFNLVSSDPPIVALGIGPRDGSMKDTARHIAATGEFVINLVPDCLADAMNATSAAFADDVDELAAVRLDTAPSLKIAPPRIKKSPAALECRTWQTIEAGENRVIILANVVAMFIEDGAMQDAEKFYVDTPKLDLIGRMHGAGWYARTGDRFLMPAPVTDRPAHG